MKLWLRIKAWYLRLGTKCKWCGAKGAAYGVCQRKECQKAAEEDQAFGF